MAAGIVLTANGSRDCAGSKWQQGLCWQQMAAGIVLTANGSRDCAGS